MSSTVPFRVVLTNKGVSRKFFTLFQGRDGSLYIHPNRQNTKPWQAPGITNDSGGMILDFKNPDTPNFELHKISFHPTGYIHVTNKNGERYRDGIRGPTFEEMVSPHLLCVITPCSLDEMPVFKKDKKCMLVDFVLPDDMSPFFITLALAKGEVEPAENDGTLVTPRFLLPLSSGYKLTFLLRAVKSKEPGERPNWPPFPFFLLRTTA